MTDPDMIGSVIDGKYQLTRALGSGAMGAVYEAEHTGTGRRVAVKVIHAGDLRKSSTLVARFQREARAAGAIETQHIAQVLDAGTDRESGLPFTVMEFLVGEDLQQLLNRLGPLAPDLVLRIGAQACLGLQKAHEAQVIHRDIKPANIFLAKRDAGENVVKVLDFGIAKVKADPANEMENAGLTRTGNILGSPLYMSPEQARGTRQLDHRTDIWSLGVVLYQLLCGRTPYHDAGALGELIISICHEAPTNVQQFAPWVPPEVAAIVHRAVRQAPRERFETAAAMLEAIQAQLPSGWAITDNMLAPMSEAARSEVAGRLSITAPSDVEPTAAQADTAESASPTPGSRVRVSTPDISVRVSAMPDMTDRASTPEMASTESALVQSRPRAATERSGSRKAQLALGAITLAGLVGGGVYLLTAMPSGASGGELQAQAAPTQAAPAELPVRRVQLVIVPDDASAEIEGAPTPVSSGIVEIIGAPGSVHRVRVFKGKFEKTRDVIITEAGAAPPKIELKMTETKPAASAQAQPAKPAAKSPGVIQSVKKIFSF